MSFSKLNKIPRSKGLHMLCPPDKSQSLHYLLWKNISIVIVEITVHIFFLSLDSIVRTYNEGWWRKILSLFCALFKILSILFSFFHCLMHNSSSVNNSWMNCQYIIQVIWNSPLLMFLTLIFPSRASPKAYIHFAYQHHELFRRQSLPDIVSLGR